LSSVKIHIPVLLIIIACSLSVSPAVFGQSPTNVFTSDIDNFWMAFDSVQTTTEKDRQLQIMQSLYIDKGTTGLKSFMQLRNFDAGKLVESIHKYPKFWRSIRENTLQVPPAVPVIEKYLARFKVLYPEMRKATIFFTITPARAAGVALDSTALIGTEIAMGNRYTDVSEFPDKRLANFFKPKETNNIVPVAIHEYVHTQQSTEGKVLLGQCIYEGSCDFITELVLGEPLTHSYLTYGKEHEKELKEAFKKEMFTEDYANWLYNGNKATTMGDLGYFMGYAICKAYYRHSKNKKLAIRQIITLNYADLSAVRNFLAASKYYRGTL
jgi:hypothetical protein